MCCAEAAESPILLATRRVNIERPGPNDIPLKDHFEEPIGLFSVERFEHRILTGS